MSICPSAGKTTVDTTTNAPYAWKLPPNTGDGSYTNLFLTKAGLVTAISGTNLTFTNTIQAEPYGFVLSGDYGSAPGNQGRNGGFWARTTSTSDGRYSRAFGFYGATDAQYPGNFNLQDNFNKSNGRAVRCVLFYGDRNHHFLTLMCLTLLSMKLSSSSMKGGIIKP